MTPLRPLLRCRQIKPLEVINKDPILLEESDVSDVLAAWPDLEHLHLTADPIGQRPAQTGTSFSTLSAFAGGRLQDLGLYLDPKSIGDVDHSKKIASFKNLSTLSVGTSPDPGEDKRRIAAYLAALCPAGTHLTAGPSRFAEPPKNELSHPMECVRALEGWEALGKLVNGTV